MRLCDHLGAEFSVVPREGATPEQARRALEATEAIEILAELFLGVDGPDGSMRDALLDMAGGSRFDLFWRRSLAELKEIVASELANGRLMMLREAPQKESLPVLLEPRVAAMTAAPADMPTAWGRPRDDRRRVDKRARSTLHSR